VVDVHTDNLRPSLAPITPLLLGTRSGADNLILYRLSRFLLQYCLAVGPSAPLGNKEWPDSSIISDKLLSDSCFRNGYIDMVVLSLATIDLNNDTLFLLATSEALSVDLAPTLLHVASFVWREASLYLPYIARDVRSSCLGETLDVCKPEVYFRFET
jgi:hypothetical protein